jgi:hypothetical protein
MVYFEELNEFFKILEKQIIDNNGIIYDTYVCDRILAYHYTNIYINKKLPLNRFYDINYDYSTIARFIKSNIIKFSFKQSLDHINFYSFITSNASIINHLNIKLEITISSDEPPFKHNNYICYGLLLSNDFENDNNFKYYYSNNTGTPYDNNSSTITSKIITDVINKRTQYIRGFYSNYEIFSDIYKMINDGWKITNLPYIVNININEITNDSCPICLEKFRITNKETITLYENIHRYNSNNYKIHHKCLFKYLNMQKNKTYFKCPYRYKIDFNICKYLITYQ